jgi:hypothetical protein
VLRRSSGSVRIAWLDKEQAIAELREYAERLVAQDARVGEVRLLPPGLSKILFRGGAGGPQ